MRPLAVVTGSSRGIGRAVAQALARRGVRLALLGRESDALDRARDECRALGGEAESYACDLEQPDAVAAATSALLERQGAPLVVVNNAGVLGRRARVEQTGGDDWDRVLAVNLRGPFLVCRALVPAMRAAGRGRLVQVGSISGTLGCPEQAAYAASKWGLIGFTKSLAEELRGSGVLAVTVLPGSVDTAMLDRSRFPQAMAPAELAELIAYYALEAPAIVQGATVEAFG